MPNNKILINVLITKKQTTFSGIWGLYCKKCLHFSISKLSGFFLGGVIFKYLEGCPSLMRTSSSLLGMDSTRILMHSKWSTGKLTPLNIKIAPIIFVAVHSAFSCVCGLPLYWCWWSFNVLRQNLFSGELSFEKYKRSFP